MQDSLITKVFLPLALFIIMWGLGLSLTLTDFKRVLVIPKAVLLGAALQLIWLPMLGFITASIFLADNPELAVGLILLSMCPGGTTANLITHLAKGDTALCITLTAISSCVKVFTIPFFVNLAIIHYMGTNANIHMNVLESIVKILAITVLPTSLGLAVRARFLGFANRAQKPVKIASAIILFCVIILAIVENKNDLIHYFEIAGPASLFLNLVGMASGYFIPQILNLPRPQRITLSIETSVQNGTLAIGIALGILGNRVASVPAAVYSLIMFITIGIFVAYLNRSNPKVSAGN